MPSHYFITMMTYFLLLAAVGFISVERERYLRRRAAKQEKARERDAPVPGDR
jgi:large-conductance mechanosensitive channel